LQVNGGANVPLAGLGRAPLQAAVAHEHGFVWTTSATMMRWQRRRSPGLGRLFLLAGVAAAAAAGVAAALSSPPLDAGATYVGDGTKCAHTPLTTTVREGAMPPTSADWPSNVTRLREMIEVWTHAALPADVRLCRIHGACRVGDGTFLLPAWMKAFNSQVVLCGITAPQYLLKAAPDGTYAVDGAYGRRISLTDGHNETDLFGVDPPGETMPAIATDLSPVLLLMDVLERTAAHAAQLTRECVVEGASACPDNETAAVVAAGVDPGLVVTSRITMQKDEKWVKGFLRLVRNAFFGSFSLLDAADLYGWKVRGVAACARSVVTTGMTADVMPAGLFPAEHFLFAVNQISRVPRATGAAVASALASAARACTVRVMVLNRFGQRYMVGDYALRSAVAAEAVAAEATAPGVTLAAEVVFFENASFHEQISMMQETNVVVASHGAGVANLLFLRPGSVLVEVLPFGIKASPFADLARLYDVVRLPLTAMPDDDVFRSCIAHFNKDGPATDALLARWAAAATSFREGGGGPAPGGDLDWGTDPAAAADTGIQNVLQCAGYQRLTFNVKEVAALAVTRGLAHCGVDRVVSTAAPISPITAQGMS